MQIGQLTIEMAANVARLTQDMSAARSVVERNAKAMRDAAGLAGKALGAIGATLTIAAFTGFIRGAIDAADATSKLAQKTGLLVPEVAGLQLAFRQSGNGADVMQTAVAKLSKNMADGSKAFAAMGINVKTTDGSLKTTRATLGEVADKFASYKDGAEKTALAQELFGKSGADLIPLLNAGASALDDYDAKAKQLGLTLSDETVKQAEAFNDTLDLAGQSIAGVGTQIAAKLLPTLVSLASEFFNTLTEGDKLTNAVDLISSSLKSLFSVGVGVSEVFKTMGTVLGGAAAGAVAMMKGDFAEANAIGNMIGQDLSASWEKAGQSINNAWAEVDTMGIAAMTTVRAESLKTAPVVDKLAKTAKTTADEFAKLRDKITGKDSGTDSDFIKNLATLQKAYQANRISLQEYLALSDKYVRSQKFMQDASQAAAKAAQEVADARKKEADSIAEWFAAQEQAAAQSLASVKDRVDGLKAEELAIAMSREKNITLAVAIEQVALARMREKQQRLNVGSETYEKIEREIEARKELISLVERQGVREAANKVEEEAQKMSESIGNTLTDALMRGFESGKDAAKNMRDTVVNMFKTLVLRPIVQAVIAPLAGGLGALGGGSALAGQAGGGGSPLGSLSMLGSLGGAFGTGMAASFTSMMQAGISGWATAAGSLIGTGSAAGIMAGLGMIAAPLIALAVLWKPLFGKTLKDAGVQGTFGGENGFEGENYKYYKGGLFRSNSTETSALAEEARKALGDTFLAMKKQVMDFADALGLSTDRLIDYTAKVKISTFGLSQEDAQKKIQEALATANNELAEQVLGSWSIVTEEVTRQVANMAHDVNQNGADEYRSVTETETTKKYTPSEFARDGEKAIDTLTRLAVSITAANAVFDTLGTTLYDKSLAGADAASKLIDAFGGVEKFMAATSSYYQNYYSESERFATAQRQVSEEFDRLGISMPRSKAELRKLIEAQDRTTDSGRAMYASLINISAAFSDVAAAVESAFANISKTTAQSVRDIQLSIMSNEQKYSFLDREIEATIAKLSTATTPEEIERLFNQANQATTQAYNLLSPEEQQRLNAEFVDRLYELEAIAQSRLDAAGKVADTAEAQVQAADNQKEASAQTREAAQQMSDAAVTMMRAAEAVMAAAREPKVIDLRINGQAAANEVTFA